MLTRCVFLSYSLPFISPACSLTLFVGCLHFLYFNAELARVHHTYFEGKIPGSKLVLAFMYFCWCEFPSSIHSNEGGNSDTDLSSTRIFQLHLGNTKNQKDKLRDNRDADTVEFRWLSCQEQTLRNFMIHSHYVCTYCFRNDTVRKRRTAFTQTSFVCVVVYGLSLYMRTARALSISGWVLVDTIIDAFLTRWVINSETIDKIRYKK